MESDEQNYIQNELTKRDKSPFDGEAEADYLGVEAQAMKTRPTPKAEPKATSKPKNTVLFINAVPPGLKADFKVLCARQGVSMSSALVGLMRRAVAQFKVSDN